MLDAGTTPEGRVWLAMELLDGLDLEQLVLRFGAQPAARVVALIRQVLASLHEAHTIGVVHRDVKPSNLFLIRGGPTGDFVKVLDFGLARAVGNGADSGLTRTGVIPGSPAYLAPEVLRGGDPTDRADVYALGCVAWWLLSGKLVFDARSPLELVVAHLERPVPQLPERVEASAGLRAVLARCLAKEAGERPTAGELTTLLSSLAGENPWTEAEARAWWAAALPAGTLLPPAPAAPTGAVAAAFPTPPLLPENLAAARESAWKQLRGHFDASRIDAAELELRSSRAARATDRSAVVAALEGLPVEVPTPEKAPPSPRPPPELPSVRSPTAELVGEALGRRWRARHRPRVVSVLGSTSRNGLWAEEGGARAVSVMGSITIDLVETPLGPGLHELRCVAVMGSITIHVPADLPVEIAGIGVLGSFEADRATPSGAAHVAGPRLRVTGAAVFGSVDVVVNGASEPARSEGGLHSHAPHRPRG